MATLSELIRHDDPISVGASAVYPYHPQLERKYRFVSRFGDEVELYRRIDDTICLPRALCPVGGEDLRSDGEVVVFPKQPIPREYQEELFAEVASLCHARKSGVVVAMTGWGKSILGLHAAYTMQRKTVIITTKEDIFDKWIADAQTFLGLKPSEIGIIRGDKCEVIGTKLCVALIQSMSKEAKYPDWVTQGFGLVIIDECHRVAANLFSNICWMFPAKMRLGLSATPDRSDGKELLLYAHIGPVRARSSVEQLVPKILRFDTGWRCPRVPRRTEEGGVKVVPLPHKPGKTTHIEKYLAKDHERNVKICNMIINAYKKDRTTLVFSTLHIHLEALEKMLRVSYGLTPNEVGIYVGVQTKKEKAKRDGETKKRVVLTTYKMCGEGTDFPWIDTCILAMPISKPEQPIGRIRRLKEGKKQPVVFDLVDQDSPVFKGYALSRDKWYRRIGAEVVEMAA